MTTHIKKITVLTNQPKKDEAQAILDRIATTVLPAMKRHNWEVKTLSEFYPKNDSLHGLNVNRGQCIKVRLRDGKDVSSFLPFEHCLGTMIHELVHMDIGPHSADFYKTMDALWDEVDRDMSGNLTNAAVYAGSGVTLGGTSCSSVRDARLTHLNKKQRLTTLSAGSGAQLGGRKDWKNLSRRELALAAAERRIQDAKQCGADMLADKIEEEGAEWMCSVCTAQNQDAANSCYFCGGRCGESPEEALIEYHVLSSVSSAVTNWTCDACTYENDASSAVCEVCGKFRLVALDAVQSPVCSSNDWVCSACTYVNNTRCDSKCSLCCTEREMTCNTLHEDAVWICNVCTFKNNDNTSSKCSMCNIDSKTQPAANQWACSICSTVNCFGEILCKQCNAER